MDNLWFFGKSPSKIICHSRFEVYPWVYWLQFLVIWQVTEHPILWFTSLTPFQWLEIQTLRSADPKSVLSTKTVSPYLV